MTVDEIKKDAIEAIEITKKMVSAKQKVSLAFAIPTVGLTFLTLLNHNPYHTLACAVPAFFTTCAFTDTVSTKMKLENAEQLIFEERFEEFIEQARSSSQIEVLNNIADVIEEELFEDDLSENDQDDDFYI